MRVDILDRDMYQGDPYPTLAWIRNNEPVYRDVNGVWALTKIEDIRWAERQPTLFSSGAIGSRPNGQAQPSMIDSDDPAHADQRRSVARGFGPRQMSAYETHVKEVAKQLVDAVIHNGSCDIVADIAKPLPMTLIGEMLGADPSKYDWLQHLSDVMITGADNPKYVTDDVINAAIEFYTYTTQVMEERRGKLGDDLISKFMTPLDDGTVMDDAHVIGNALLLLVGGNETTRNVIAGGLEAMIRRPDQMAIARRSPADLDRAIEEAVRWVTPIVNMVRVTTRDVEVRGVTIPAGSQVLMHYTAANRDEDFFDRPDEFDVTRDENPHISFGWGPHLCLGASLARLELRIIYTEIFERMNNLAFADANFVPQYGHASFVRGMKTLPVTFDAS